MKIDQSFLANLGHGPEPAAIVEAIIKLGHAMGLQVTAEGIETAGQRDFVIAAGVDEMQGYLFAPPMQESALASLPGAFLPSSRGNSLAPRVSGAYCEAI